MIHQEYQEEETNQSLIYVKASLFSGAFLFKTKYVFFDYLYMIILLPVSTSQTIKIVPRSYLEDSNVQLKITEDGTRKTETLTGLTATYSGNFIEIPCTFSILSESKMYYIEVTRSGSLLYRDKAYCTAQTNRTIPHTLNTGKYDEHTASPSGQKYITI